MSRWVTTALVLACHLLGGGIEALFHRHVDGRHHEPGCDDDFGPQIAKLDQQLAAHLNALSAPRDAPVSRHRHEQCRRCTSPISTPGTQATKIHASHTASVSFAAATTDRGSADMHRVHAPRGPPQA